MVRRYRRRAYKTVRYSNETVTVQAATKFIDADQKQLEQIDSEIVKSFEAGGIRKAKNFTLQITTNSTYPLWWVLVYVPQGTSPSQIRFGSPTVPTSIYEPNQNVIMSGVVGPGSNQQTWRTRLVRDLYSGDSIQICFSSPYVSQIWQLQEPFELNCIHLIMQFHFNKQFIFLNV